MPPEQNYQPLLSQIRQWARELGFADLGITDVDLGKHPEHLRTWLALGRHGEMDYMARNADKRARPEMLIPDTLRILSVRLDYQPTGQDPEAVLANPEQAYISRYALGRDYHKMMRKRLARLAKRISAAAPGAFRAFVDSAPVLEKAIAEKSGHGWIGKHTLVINRSGGSYFFLGEIYTDLPLPVSQTIAASSADGGHCGTCTACLDCCPTRAIVAPYQLDARRCISYLTIENRGAIPEPLRPLLGNRIFGCDDCQLVCPWNRFATPTVEADFLPRHNLDQARLVELFNWTETEYLEKTAGSPLRRPGYQGWLRNLAVALGNGPATAEAISALEQKKDEALPMVAEHIRWALSTLASKLNR